MTQEQPSIEYLNECFEIKSNRLYWKERPESHFPTHNKKFTDHINEKNAGKRAGMVDNGYLRLKINSKSYLVHRVMFAMYHGKWPEGVVDHINRNTLDNSKENLRDVPRKINAKNAKITKSNTSGVNGVRKVRSGRWVARVKLDYKYIHIGTYDTIEEAAAAQKQKAAELGFTAHHGT